MILSSPFSRQNKSHQTWHHAATSTNGHAAQSQTNGYVQQQQQQHATLTAKSTPAPRHQLYSSASLRKPAPQQPAPLRPINVQSPPPTLANNCSPQAGKTNGVLLNSHVNMDNRASTLNRLDLLKRRQQQQVASPTSVSLRRNLSSLGHYPAQTSGLRHPTTNGDQQIYAPASIASPRELHRQPPDVGSPQQHYASTSVHNQHLTATHRSHRSSVDANTGGRPESALGQLWERFGTLRRKSSWRRWTGGRSWSRQSQGRADTPHSQIYAPASLSHYRPASVASGGTVRSTKRGVAAAKHQPSIPASPPPPPPDQPLILDAEIYASGKRQVEPEAIYAEGSHALDSNAERRLLEHQLDPELMAEGETRTLVDELSERQPEFRQLVGTLTGWINDELASERIIVRDLQEDLHDGQVLCKLVEKLQQVHLDMVEVTQNEQTQKHKLQIVLGALNRYAISSQQQQQQRNSSNWRIRWSVEGIHAKNLVEILHLLIAMALFYRAPLRLPPNVQVTVLVFQRHQGELVRRSHQVELTDESVSTALDQLTFVDHLHPLRLHAQSQRDAFDTLLESAPPEKINLVKQSLIRFCNRHLNKINMSCHGQVSAGASGALDPHQFSDGLLLVFLISTLEDYFVPLGNLFTRQNSQPGAPGDSGLLSASSVHMDANNNNHNLQQEPIGAPTALEPTSYVNTQPIEKLHNVNVALQLMEDAGLTGIKQRVRAEEIVNGDMKAVLRILYSLFGRYKHL